MPNHITSNIHLEGEKSKVEELIESYSTRSPSEPQKDFNGNLTYLSDTEEYSYGWLNTEDNTFVRRGQATVKGVPEGYSQVFTKEFTRFPDFEKVHPIPEIIKKVGNIHGGISTAVKARCQAPISGNILLARLQISNRMEAKDSFEDPEDQRKFELSCKAYEETGFAYWYDWQIAKWGTKWNSYDHEKINESKFKFETAWSGVPEIIRTISKNHPEVKISYEWADEDTGCNCGTAVFMEGEKAEDPSDDLPF